MKVRSNSGNRCLGETALHNKGHELPNVNIKRVGNYPFIYIIYMHTSYIFIYMRYIDISSGERYVYIVWRNSELLLMLLAFAVLSGVPNPRDLMPDDLKCNLCNNNRNKVHNKCNAPESSQNHPSSVYGNMSSLRPPVPGAKMVWDC